MHPGRSYLILDDTLTMGGTLAPLRGYVENRGGKVIGASVMTARRGGVDLAVKPTMLEAIARKHGPTMDTFWRETFGYGVDYLTQSEAGHLRAAASVDAIRVRIAAARHEGIERLDAGRDQAPVSAAPDKPAEGQEIDDWIRAVKAETKRQA